MSMFAKRRKVEPGKAGRRPRQVVVESLEPRVLLHAEGIAWSTAPDLTISFAKDGTDIAGQSSSLFADLGEFADADAWQGTIIRAFRVWAAETNTSLSVVADSGDPYGASGPTQGDTRFGDIRVGSLPLSEDIIAMSIPHNEIISGTWAGDFLFNSNATLSNLDDVFSVALHEAGHIFGLGHSDDPLSPMYYHGISDAIEPTTQDVLDLQELYSLKVQDEQPDEDRTRVAAKKGGEEAEDDKDDKDDENRDDRDDVDEAADDDGEDDLDNAETEVDPGNADMVAPDADANADLSKKRVEDDDHDHDGRTNGSLENADKLVVSPKLMQITRYETSGRIEAPGDLDYFALAPSELDIDDLEYLSVTVRTSSTEGLVPEAAVFDKEGKQLETRVLANANGLLVLQASDADPSETHFIRVGAAKARKALQSGSYDLVAQFSGREKKLGSIATGSLDTEKPVKVSTIYIPQTRLVHVALRLDKVADPSPVLGWAVIYDEAGQVVSRVASPTGETRSARTVLLQPGVYRLEFHAGQAGSSQIPEIEYELFAEGITIPIGPGISDPTAAPILPCDDPGADPNYCSPPDVIISDPIVFPDTFPVPPEPIVSVQPPWTDFDWWFWDHMSFGAIAVTLPSTSKPDVPITVLPGEPAGTIVGDPANTPVADSAMADTVPANGLLPAKLLHNPGNAKDVNGDGIVSAMDVLAVINYLNRSTTTPASDVSGFVDVNNDTYISSIDALLITNELNAPASQAAEGEAKSQLIVTNDVELDAVMAEWDEPLSVDSVSP